MKGESVNTPLFLVPFGVLVGVFSGLMGLGGGAVIIPILVLLFGMDQQSAHGTSLAMILSPTALPAIYKYHQGRFIDWRLVMFVVPGMLIGSYLGAKIATSISQEALKLVFGFILIYVAGYTVFGSLGKEHLTRTLILSGALVLIGVGMFSVVKRMDQSSRGAETARVVSE